jgi:hypothetical protein
MLTNVTGRKYIKFTIDHMHLTILQRAHLEKPNDDKMFNQMSLACRAEAE